MWLFTPGHLGFLISQIYPGPGRYWENWFFRVLTQNPNQPELFRSCALGMLPHSIHRLRFLPFFFLNHTTRDRIRRNTENLHRLRPL